MAKRLDASLKTYLAGIFVEKLSQVLKEAGFRETLHIPEPDVTEFQRDAQVVTLQVHHVDAHHRQVIVESESVDVTLPVEAATRATVVEIARDLVEALPVPEGSTSQDVAARLAELLSSTPSTSPR
ncbi:MAG: hypothetical protein ACM3US_12565 [Sphingomonadaceae bacterium]